MCVQGQVRQQVELLADGERERQGLMHELHLAKVGQAACRSPR